MKLSDIHLRDPFILAEDGVYYLYGTRRGPTTKVIPWQGLDVYTSTDLTEWSEPRECFTRPADFWADRDFFAPEVHKYRGAYYMFASFRSETRLRCSQILKSDSPLGPFVPFSDGPITPEGQACLDATFYVDDRGVPWTAYCHEWTQIGNGTIDVMPLTPDLTRPAGEPKTILRAGDVPWAYSLNAVRGQFVTDGPFFRKGKNGKLYMLWSSFRAGPQHFYVQALAVSDSGSILGPWRHADRFIYDEDGGHGMIFDGFDGNSYLILHTTNVNPNERPRLFKVRETDDGFEIEGHSRKPGAGPHPLSQLQSRILREAKWVTDYVRDNNFKYGDAPMNPAIDHDAKLVSCDRLVDWVMYRVGFTDQVERQGMVVYHATEKARDLPGWCELQGFARIEDVDRLEPGDIVFVRPGTSSAGVVYPQHTFLFAGYAEGAGDDRLSFRYDCGKNERIQSIQPSCEPLCDFMFAYRPCN